jgi:nucleotide-binding universal stress UspA family protein
MNILMATDGSKEATTALLTASRLLRPGARRVDLLCVAPEFYSPKGAEKKKGKRGGLGEEYRRRVALETKRILAQAQEVLGRAGLEAGTRSEVGSPAGVIVRLAGEYDLVVVGAHDRYERSKPGLGPVGSRVVAHAPGAVLVGRELAAERNWRILAAVDGSLASGQALRLMASHFRVQAAEITLMHVAETPWVHLGLGREWFDYGGAAERADPEVRLERELRLEAEAVVEGARLQLERYGLAATTVIEEGDPALEILSEAEKDEYDLIVLGATGEADLKHHMLGSVSTKVAQNAPCSVFVAKFAE